MRARDVVGLLLLPLTACGDDDVVPANDAGMDSGHDASNGDATIDAGNTERWIATKTTLDVWWPWTGFVDAGRGHVEVTTLTRAASRCDDMTTSAIRACGLTLPTFVSTASCEAHQLSVPDAVWNAHSTPDVVLRDGADHDSGSAAARLETWLGLDPRSAESWPASVDQLTCGTGTGLTCFVDHDEDARPGISVVVRNDDAVYANPPSGESCIRHFGDVERSYPYRYAAPRTPRDLEAPGGSADRAIALQLGFRAAFPMLGAPAALCMSGEARDSALQIDLALAGCEVDRTTSPQCDEYEINTARLMFPSLRVLVTGETPGPTSSPFGTYPTDIDRSPSEGARVQTVEINMDDIDAGGDGGPSCAQARAAFPTE